MTDPISLGLFERARTLMPGGVNSPVRAFKAVGGYPVFIERARGSHVFGADGTDYIDYVGSWGPAILGHAHPEVVAAVQRAAERGLSFGAPTELEVRFAEAIRERYPSIEMLRCVSSGTEATMSALRVARGHTKRDVIVKFDGAYHGHHDALLVKAGSGAATFGAPDSAGIPRGMVETTATLPYNDIAALEAFFDQEGARIAAVIVEPVAGNMGCVPPEPGFLQCIVDACSRHGAVSIFDEVMTGFRVAAGGAQGRYGVSPDLTCLGKIAGGGLPLAVYGGRAALMKHVAPLGGVYQAGTLSGNPLATSAGLATLERLDGAVYETLEARGAQLEAGLANALRERGVGGVVQRVGSMLTLFFHDGPVRSWREASASDTARFATWHAGLLSRGVYWPPSQYEAAFISAEHTEDELERTIRAARDALG
ncbi:MAG: glutamate-1-semialdehyde 2,1-aminomutase [Sorangiineae bacterium]|nr:glutamate-1-semialdehyde 2,1-aminomutase [Polyangiaceae bacterium]MEB2323623.1 glutamate-1-semialdehyde 2,1-aminomutase [Sorangiineae bacterium]